MNQTDLYEYLIKSRRDLWQFLENLPGEILSRSVLNGRFNSIKDLLFHIAVVEDSWLHEDIRNQPVWLNFPGYPAEFEAEFHAGKPLDWLIGYHKAVETASIKLLASNLDLQQQISFKTKSGEIESFSIDGIIWHVMQHEIRHSAQIVLLTRLAGYEPPQLDLIRYL